MAVSTIVPMALWRSGPCCYMCIIEYDPWLYEEKAMENYDKEGQLLLATVSTQSVFKNDSCPPLVATALSHPISNILSRCHTSR